MNLFDDIIAATKKKMLAAGHRELDIAPDGEIWPASSGPELVLEKDAGVELGHPAEGSFSLLLWTADASLVQPGRLTLAGPDLHESGTQRRPFVKIVLLLVNGFDENNCHARHRELALRHHRLALKGYMVRAASLYQQEWSRVDRGILERGYGFAGLGRSLSRLYMDQPYVQAVEMMVSTAALPGPEQFEALGRRAAARIAAMNRMVDELAFDCSDCAYTDVCGEIAALRAMRETLRKSHGRRKGVNRAG